MSDFAETLVRRMNEAARDLSSPLVRPKDAATLILVDRTAGKPKVLLGRRHQNHKFMPGKFVFPGGRMEPIDRKMALKARLDPHVEDWLMRAVQRPNPRRARALVLAAIRETFEETGLLLGVPKTSLPAEPALAASALWTALAQAGIHPDLGNIHFVVRAITPPGRSRRFDTRFFTADAATVTHRLEGIVGPDSELVELVWIPIDEAKRLDMPAITGVALDELERRVAAGLTHDLPVPFYRMRNRRFSRVLL
ncbi:MAG: NUDIX domain-containing protein [Xanthobacteraceae bacterium]|nr:NUDIX domain-containing protein [Xanthobacteraceae bacterium]MBV9234972.1 NUDIX domain-containing protein [Xanthobacteraceae bacterium]MBV9628780.1 NUDIX domain-containing protein [Xanthobacteraceae bacterium]